MHEICIMKSTATLYNKQIDETTYQIEIFGEIDSYFGSNLQSVAYELSQFNGKKINVVINSVGGSVLEGIAVYNFLKNHKAKIVTENIGISASIASVVLMAGDKIKMARNSFIMIHNVWSFAQGGKDDLRQTADVMEKMEAEILDIYANAIAERGKLIDGNIDKTKAHIKDLMDKETWLNAEESLALGLIDEIVNNVDYSSQNEGKASLMTAMSNKIPSHIYNKIIGKDENMKETEQQKKTVLEALANLLGIKNEVETITPVVEEKKVSVEEALKTLEEAGYTVTQKQQEPVVDTEKEELKNKLTEAEAKIELLNKNAYAKESAGLPSATPENPTQESNLGVNETRERGIGALLNRMKRQ